MPEGMLIVTFDAVFITLVGICKALRQTKIGVGPV
jgi:hypothetical protein